MSPTKIFRDRCIWDIDSRALFFLGLQKTDSRKMEIERAIRLY